MIERTIAALALALALASCGGGGEPPKSASSLGYSNTAQPRHSFTPYTTRSHVFTWGPTNEVFIGADLEPKEDLRHVATQNGIRYYMGASRDGVGINRIENYEHDLISQDGDDFAELYGDDGFYPFNIQPVIHLDAAFTDPENEEILGAVFESILILNDILPPEFQIALGNFYDGDQAFYGEIMVNLESPSGIAAACGAGAAACASNRTVGGYSTSARVYIPDDFDTSEYSLPRKVIIHELLHALGIQGHVDSTEFPDSIMGTAGETIPNLGHIISKIDREVLQIMYMQQRTDLYSDYGEWSDTTHHLIGRSEDEALNFGVGLFNGLPLPWVRGTLPETALAANRGLRGSATWTGSLLAFSGPSPLAGRAELQVRLSTLTDPGSEQDLRFRDIYFLNRFESEAPDRWFHTRDIDYKVTVSGNKFLNVREEGYEQGFVTGAFLGPEHEHMGGTVKRTDMVGAFGGSR